MFPLVIDHTFAYHRGVHPKDTVRQAFELSQQGLTQSAVCDDIGVGRATVGRWLRQGVDASLRSSRRAPSADDCPDSCPLVEAAPPSHYAYLLGQYLGDGSISAGPRGVYRLTLTCCAAYPVILSEAVTALKAVLPDNSISRRVRRGAIDVSCYSKHLPCLFPQHGPGVKHARPIVLDDWQTSIALAGHPDQLLRGLIHSDGCRSMNRVRGRNGRTYEYVRCTFSNRSDDIRGLFCLACEELGIEWRQMNRCNISVARRTSVQKLDEIVGPKA